MTEKQTTKKTVNTEVGSCVVFQKALELFTMHRDPNNDLCGMDHEGRVMILNSIDGANHDLNDKSHTEVLTSGISLLSNKSVNCPNPQLPSNPAHILTILQARCKENYHNFHHLTDETFFKPCSESGTFEGIIKGEVEVLHLHDGKMQHGITQHISWSSSFHPFLLCGCERGKGVINNLSHKCKMWKQVDYKNCYNKSEAQFKKLLKKMKGPKT